MQRDAGALVEELYLPWRRRWNGSTTSVKYDSSPCDASIWPFLSSARPNTRSEAFSVRSRTVTVGELNCGPAKPAMESATIDDAGTGLARRAVAFTERDPLVVEARGDVSRVVQRQLVEVEAQHAFHVAAQRRIVLMIASRLMSTGAWRRPDAPVAVDFGRAVVVAVEAVDADDRVRIFEP